MEKAGNVLANDILRVENEIAHVSKALKVVFHFFEILIKVFLIWTVVWDPDEGNTNVSFLRDEVFVVFHRHYENLNHLITRDFRCSIRVDSFSVEDVRVRRKYTINEALCSFCLLRTSL